MGRGGFWSPPDGVTPTRRVQAAGSGRGPSPAAARRARRTPAEAARGGLRGERRVEELADHHLHPRPRAPVGWSHLGALPPAAAKSRGSPALGAGTHCACAEVRLRPLDCGRGGRGLLCACARARPVPPLDRPEAGGHVGPVPGSGFRLLSANRQHADTKCSYLFVFSVRSLCSKAAEEVRFSQ